MSQEKQSFDGANSLEAESEQFDLSVYSVDYEKVSTRYSSFKFQFMRYSLQAAFLLCSY